MRVRFTPNLAAYVSLINLVLAHSSLVSQISENPSVCSYFHPPVEGVVRAVKQELQRHILLQPGIVGQETCQANDAALFPQILGKDFYEMYMATAEICAGELAALDADLCVTLDDDSYSDLSRWSASVMDPKTQLEAQKRRLHAGKGRSAGEKMVLLNFTISEQRRESRTVAPVGCRPNPFRFALFILGQERYRQTLAWFRDLSAQCEVLKVVKKWDAKAGEYTPRCSRTTAKAAHMCAVHRDPYGDEVCDVDKNVLMVTMFGGMNGPLARIMAWEDECESRSHANCKDFCSWVSKSVWLDLLKERQIFNLDIDDESHQSATATERRLARPNVTECAVAALLIGVLLVLFLWVQRPQSSKCNIL